MLDSSLFGTFLLLVGIPIRVFIPNFLTESVVETDPSLHHLLANFPLGAAIIRKTFTSRGFGLCLKLSLLFTVEIFGIVIVDTHRHIIGVPVSVVGECRIPLAGPSSLARFPSH